MLLSSSVTSRRPIRQEGSHPRPKLQSVRRIDKFIKVFNLCTVFCKRQDKCVLIPIRSDRRLSCTPCMYDTCVRLRIMRLLGDSGLYPS
jgi:hypothetical protein